MLSMRYSFVRLLINLAVCIDLLDSTANLVMNFTDVTWKDKLAPSAQTSLQELLADQLSINTQISYMKKQNLEGGSSLKAQLPDLELGWPEVDACSAKLKNRFIVDQCGNVYKYRLLFTSDATSLSLPCRKYRSRRQVPSSPRSVQEGIQTSNVLVNAESSNVTVSQLINISSGRSIVDVRQEPIRVKVLSERGDVRIDPRDYYVNISAHTSFVSANISDRISLHSASSYSDIYINTQISNAQLPNVLISSGPSNMSIITAGGASIEALVEADSRVAVRIGHQENVTQEEVLIDSRLVDSSGNYERELTMTALTVSARMDAQFIEAWFWIRYNTVEIEISSQRHEISIFTGTYTIRVTSLLAPFRIRITDIVILEIDNSTLTVFPDTSNVTGRIPNSLLMIRPDNESTVQFVANEEQSALENSAIDLESKDLTLQISPFLKRIRADSVLSNALITSRHTTVGLRANRTRMEVLSGTPYLRAMTGNTTIEIRSAGGALTLPGGADIGVGALVGQPPAYQTVNPPFVFTVGEAGVAPVHPITPPAFPPPAPVPNAPDGVNPTSGINLPTVPNAVLPAEPLLPTPLPFPLGTPTTLTSNINATTSTTFINTTSIPTGENTTSLGIEGADSTANLTDIAEAIAQALSQSPVVINPDSLLTTATQSSAEVEHSLTTPVFQTAAQESHETQVTSFTTILPLDNETVPLNITVPTAETSPAITIEILNASETLSPPGLINDSSIIPGLTMPTATPTQVPTSNIPEAEQSLPIDDQSDEITTSSLGDLLTTTLPSFPISVSVPASIPNETVSVPVAIASTVLEENRTEPVVTTIAADISTTSIAVAYENLTSAEQSTTSVAPGSDNQTLDSVPTPQLVSLESEIVSIQVPPMNTTLGTESPANVSDFVIAQFSVVTSSVILTTTSVADTANNNTAGPAFEALTLGNSSGLDSPVAKEYMLSVGVRVRRSSDTYNNDFLRVMRQGLLQAYVEGKDRQLGLQEQRRRVKRQKAVTERPTLGNSADGSSTASTMTNTLALFIPGMHQTRKDTTDVKLTSVDRTNRDQTKVRFYVLNDKRLVEAAKAKDTYEQLSVPELSSFLTYPVMEPIESYDSEETLTSSADLRGGGVIVAVLASVAAILVLTLILAAFFHWYKRKAMVASKEVKQNEAQYPQGMDIRISKDHLARDNADRMILPAESQSGTLGLEKKVHLAGLPTLKTKMIRELSAGDVDEYDDISYSELFGHVQPPAAPTSARRLIPAGGATRIQSKPSTTIVPVSATNMSSSKPSHTKQQVLNLSPADRRRLARRLLDAAFPLANVRIEDILQQSRTAIDRDAW